MNISRRVLLLALPALALPALGASYQISWASGSPLSPAEPIMTSDGSTPVTLSTFTVEVGGFSGGFTPTVANMNDWVANWVVFDEITVPEPALSNDHFTQSTSPDAKFSGVATLGPGNTSLLVDADDQDGTGNVLDAGWQAYVFIRNQDTPTSGAEWALYTGNGVYGDDVWVFPDTSASAPAADPWWLLYADTAIVGSINGDKSNESIGGGDYNTSGPTSFAIRTHSVAPVPEPDLAAALLAGLALIAILRRR